MNKPDILKNNIFENLIRINTADFQKLILIDIEKDLNKQQLHRLIQLEEQQILKAHHHGIWGKKTWDITKKLSFLYMQCAEQFLQNDIQE